MHSALHSYFPSALRTHSFQFTRMGLRFQPRLGYSDEWWWGIRLLSIPVSWTTSGMSVTACGKNQLLDPVKFESGNLEPRVICSAITSYWNEDMLEKDEQTIAFIIANVQRFTLQNYTVWFWHIFCISVTFIWINSKLGSTWQDEILPFTSMFSILVILMMCY